MPGLRHADGQRSRLGVYALPEPRLRWPALAAADELLDGDGYRRARREAGDAVHGSWVGPHGRRLLPIGRRADRLATRFRGGLRGEARRGDRGVEAAAVW